MTTISSDTERALNAAARRCTDTLVCRDGARAVATAQRAYARWCRVAAAEAWDPTEAERHAAAATEAEQVARYWQRRADDGSAKA